MLSVPNIKSFTHQCRPSTKILIFELPTNCPICSGCVDASSVTSPVVQYPSPFVPADVVPFSIVIHPTVGDFLKSYGQGDNLHAGVTTSSGSVYSFDESGVSLDTSSWHQCLAVRLLEEYDVDLLEDWNTRLAEMAVKPEWQSDRYRTDSYNCFDFVVSFLNAIGYDPSHQDRTGPITREDFCDAFIVPVTTRAAGYIGIHRSIAKHGFLVEHPSLC